MLPASARMRRREEFAAAVRQGRRAGRAALVVHSLPTDAADAPRVGFIVPRSIGPAVVRNRVRRRLRHLLRERLERLAPGSRVVVRVLAPAAGMSSAALETELDRVLARVGAA